MPEPAVPEPAAREPDTTVHISSAVVRTLPDRCAEVVKRVGTLPDTEIHHVADGRIVVVMEGPDSATLGGRLATIATFDGVLSANLVFEQVTTLADLGESP
ncbi:MULTISPECIES: chaperone NapD [unclassified Chelatococcus]|uniref:chaperone NapD n=1 Tax=unclassified Chelatococcus TaxID=2638111 RepID=UPI000310F3B3|nr:MULTISPECIES: chaperone NapD [unclassified Chelatococcus]ALA20025.1 nitrate reductase formation protein NapD [Chelatococcus sp. CO-6]